MVGNCQLGGRMETDVVVGAIAAAAAEPSSVSVMGDTTVSVDTVMGVGSTLSSVRLLATPVVTVTVLVRTVGGRQAGVVWNLSTRVSQH